MRRFKCWQCGAVTDEVNLLRAPNPFNSDEHIIGCPKCFQVSELELVCDELGCNSVVACGTPTPSGYRMTCSEHKPKEQA